MAKGQIALVCWGALVPVFYDTIIVFLLLQDFVYKKHIKECPEQNRFNTPITNVGLIRNAYLDNYINEPLFSAFIALMLQHLYQKPESV